MRSIGAPQRLPHIASLPKGIEIRAAKRLRDWKLSTTAAVPEKPYSAIPFLLESARQSQKGRKGAVRDTQLVCASYQLSRVVH
ncbi:SAGA-associated factor 29 [Fusarium oxysporum f. sp. albedinis]|nr:SAGA-associated factor 29 [Fusarium oxysporum f. sp. albedinis]